MTLVYGTALTNAYEARLVDAASPPNLHHPGGIIHHDATGVK